jgi:hypothetical protein
MVNLQIKILCNTQGMALDEVTSRCDYNVDLQEIRAEDTFGKTWAEI